MTSFSDFPIFFAMSLTLNFAAAIESPGCAGLPGTGLLSCCVTGLPGCRVAWLPRCSVRVVGHPTAFRQPGNPATFLLHLCLFLRCFSVFDRLTLGLPVVRCLVLLFFFVAFGR